MFGFGKKKKASSKLTQDVAKNGNFEDAKAVALKNPHNVEALQNLIKKRKEFTNNIK